jgi:demethylmenaquinone methyltransferase/2-methoxy-6-polyprenyl-1,4-benzoquinol methylase
MIWQTISSVAEWILSGGLSWQGSFAACRPVEVLDLATGSGDLALAIRKACPEARLTAADFCLPMLEQAQR